MSKGSKQRPTDLQRFGDNYDAIFGKKENPYMESARLQAESNALPDVQVASTIHTSKLPDTTGFWEYLQSNEFKKMMEERK